MNTDETQIIADWYYQSARVVARGDRDSGISDNPCLSVAPFIVTQE